MTQDIATDVGAAVPAQALVKLARQLQRRLDALIEAPDPAWSAHFCSRWPVLRLVPDAGLRAELLRTLLMREHEDAPSLQHLARPQGKLALLDTDAMRRSLLALALACRPGVLRCCIDREVGQVLEHTLGPFHPPLLEASLRGRPVGVEAASWSPLHWACMGYLDWLSLLKREDGLLRQVVRLGLPPGLLGMPQRRRTAPRETRPCDALALLIEGGWPC